MSVHARTSRPLPVIDEDSRPYWNAARDHLLLLPVCDDCGNAVFYPRVLCPSCKSESLTWTELSGIGTVHSFTIVRFAISPAFANDLPYVVALVSLHEGAVILANVVDCDPDSVEIGLSVEVTFLDLDDNIALPQFRPRHKA